MSNNKKKIVLEDLFLSSILATLAYDFSFFSQSITINFRLKEAI